MHRKAVKRVVVGVVVFAAGVCLGVVAGVYVTWACCLSWLAALVVVAGGGVGW